jgi:hypothetical protein
MVFSKKKKVSKFLRPNPKAFRLANKVFFLYKKNDSYDDLATAKKKKLFKI